MNFSGKSVGTRKTQGIFWELTATEILSDPNKTTYANSFALYVLNEYYLDFHDLSALKMATTLFSFLEKKSYDPLTNGYQEDFSHNW